MGGGSGGGGNGGRKGGGGDGGQSGPLSPSQAQATPFEKMPGYEKALTEHAAEDRYGREVKPNIWRQGDKERLYVPMEVTHSKNTRQQAGYVTKNANDARSNFAQEYKGLTIVPDSQGRTGKMKRFVDTLLG